LAGGFFAAPEPIGLAVEEDTAETFFLATGVPGVVDPALVASELVKADPRLGFVGLLAPPTPAPVRNVPVPGAARATACPAPDTDFDLAVLAG
jgi:hypothetical protein